MGLKEPNDVRPVEPLIFEGIERCMAETVSNEPPRKIASTDERNSFERLNTLVPHAGFWLWGTGYIPGDRRVKSPTHQ
jgi:hypothetical protein